MATGLQILNSDGKLAFETGAHVLSYVPGFREKIGEVAATWAVAEGHLGCCYAGLLGLEPSAALKKLGKQGAGQLINNAKKVAEAKLAGDELATLLDLLDELDHAGKQRNRVQHDLWSRRVGDDLVLYAVHVDNYRRLFLEVMNNREGDAQGAAAERSIAVAEQYAADASNAFTVENLEELREEIELVSQGLVGWLLKNIAKE